MSARQPRVLIAHRDAEWVGKAKQKLEELGYSVTDCLELEWAPDLLSGSRPFELAAISSELDAGAQADIVRAVRDGGIGTKIMLLLDELDSASMHVRGQTGLITHRVSSDLNLFALAVAGQVGVPPKPHP